MKVFRPSENSQPKTQLVELSEVRVGEKFQVFGEVYLNTGHGPERISRPGRKPPTLSIMRNHLVIRVA